MHSAYPWLMTAAAVIASVGLVRLLHPPRLRVPVSHLRLWEQAAERVGRQHAWRRPQVWTLLVALGGVALAVSVGGTVQVVRQAAPSPVLVLVANTPQLEVRGPAAGQRELLLARLDTLFASLDSRTPVRLASPGMLAQPADFQARQWPARRREFGQAIHIVSPVPDATASERAYRRPGDTTVYLLGQFSAVPMNRSDVQWIFCPPPARDDIGITAAGAARTAGGVELFAEVRRFAGPGATVRLAILGPHDEPLAASGPLDLVSQPIGRTIVALPASTAGNLRVALSRPDDQPANDRFHLEPQRGEALATFEAVGRPNEWIVRAAAAGRLGERSASGPPADWLVVNEPADPVASSPGQGLVIVDPLVPPAGVRVTGELRDVKVASHRADGPWASLPLDGLTIKRASQVTLDPRWQAIATDNAARPLIAWDPAGRQLAIFFSVAPENPDWFRRASWPLFWGTLSALAPSRAGAAATRWTWEPVTLERLRTEESAEAAINWPAETFDVAPGGEQVATAIRLPPPQPGEEQRPVWAWLAGAAAILLLSGWWLRSRESAQWRLAGSEA
ncbi:MAG: hypothetical protein PHU85_14390 [Phycisphaerae bacterium]|nr:hypothetical protein [Phycisphaerae bacterium]